MNLIKFQISGQVPNKGIKGKPVKIRRGPATVKRKSGPKMPLRATKCGREGGVRALDLKARRPA
jgi:hypothetical protein